VKLTDQERQALAHAAFIAAEELRKRTKQDTSRVAMVVVAVEQDPRTKDLAVNVAASLNQSVAIDALEMVAEGLRAVVSRRGGTLQ